MFTGHCFLWYSFEGTNWNIGLECRVTGIHRAYVCHGTSDCSTTESKLFFELDFVKDVHSHQRCRLHRTNSRQSNQSTSLQNPESHTEHYIPVHVRCLHSVQHVLLTVPGECQRLNDSAERPLLSHEKQFERFPRPVYAILSSGLLYCSQRLP